MPCTRGHPKYFLITSRTSWSASMAVPRNTVYTPPLVTRCPAAAVVPSVGPTTVGNEPVVLPAPADMADTAAASLGCPSGAMLSSLDDELDVAAPDSRLLRPPLMPVESGAGTDGTIAIAFCTSALGTVVNAATPFLAERELLAAPTPAPAPVPASVPAPAPAIAPV